MWIGPVHPRRSSREKIRRSRLKEDRAKSSARGKKKFRTVTAGDRVRMGNASRAIYARSASPATSHHERESADGLWPSRHSHECTDRAPTRWAQPKTASLSSTRAFQHGGPTTGTPKQRQRARDLVRRLRTPNLNKVFVGLRQHLLHLSRSSTRTSARRYTPELLRLYEPPCRTSWRPSKANG